ncbi:MAG: hypothetical protein KatS3mg082_0087 [Nitrospiraceae bacterium]|nr:MAG: hypothetical protein KatS3mg082_0087 [Nitrospiraceae bacterium]
MSSFQHQGRVHLLVTDMLMPAMNGLELATKVQALSPATRILYIIGKLYREWRPCRGI